MAVYITSKGSFTPRILVHQMGLFPSRNFLHLEQIVLDLHHLMQRPLGKDLLLLIQQ